jgi:hypothetical protein
MDEELDYCPTWLYKDLVEDSLPWDEGHVLSFAQFHEKYTLHDSYWIVALYNPSSSDALTLCVRWDPMWNLGEELEKSSLVASWPFLFVRIERVIEAKFPVGKFLKELAGTIGGSESITLEGKHVVSISDIADGRLTIEYSGEVRFLAMNSEKTIIAI